MNEVAEEVRKILIKIERFIDNKEHVKDLIKKCEKIGLKVNIRDVTFEII